MLIGAVRGDGAALPALPPGRREAVVTHLPSFLGKALCQKQCALFQTCPSGGIVCEFY